MKSLVEEFEFLFNEEEYDDKNFMETSKKLVSEVNNFKKKSEMFPKATYQGISVNNICRCLYCKKTEIADWEHVMFFIDLGILKDVNNDRLTELYVPTFVEEIQGSCNKVNTEFGFNQTARNNIEYIKIPKLVTIIAPSTFAFYKKLESIQFEEKSKLIYLGDYAFANCEKLSTLDLSKCEMLDTIKQHTFENSGIKHLKISTNITCMFPIENTKIIDVTVGEQIYNIKEFNAKLNELGGNGEVFWGYMDFDF